MHEQLADFTDFKRLPNEDEYTFRKRFFIFIYPKGYIMAFEILFCVEDWYKLATDDKELMETAKELFKEKGNPGLTQFLGIFGEDPAIFYKDCHVAEI